MPHTLDNPFWTALRELHGAFAQGAGEVLHYPPDIAPFVAIAHPDVAMVAPSTPCCPIANPRSGWGWRRRRCRRAGGWIRRSCWRR